MRKAGTKGHAYHHGNLPQALLAAVAAIIRQRGVGGVSLREAARRVGVSHAAPAHHFVDKAGLLAAFATQGFRRLREQTEQARLSAPAAMPAERLRAVGVAYVLFAAANAEHFRVMFRPDILREDDPDLLECGEGAFQVLVTAVADCQRVGFAASANPRHVAVAAWSLVHGLATLWVDGPLGRQAGGDSLETLALEVAAIFGMGLGNPQDPSRSPHATTGHARQ